MDKINGHLTLRPKHLIFVGNGAIEGGSLPLMRAIADTTGKQVPESAAASVAAVLAQEFKNKKYFALKDLMEILDNVGSLDKYFADYYSFKVNLSKHYLDSFKSGTVKRRAATVIHDLLASATPSDIGLITTNWDHCFWDAQHFENVIQLHGLSSHPDSIVLPGEFSDDEALTEILDSLGFSIKDEATRNQVFKIFRGNFRRPLAAALQTAGFWLAGAETIHVWGLAFHAYDSEVCQLAWATGRESRGKKIITIINPSDADRAMCKFLFSAPQHEFSELSA